MVVSARDSKQQQILTPNQVAEMLMVSPAAVRQWASRGDLQALTTPGGHRRFKIADVVSFANNRGMSLHAQNELATILIVDDDEQFAHMLKELLESFEEDSVVYVATDGFQAGKLVHSIHPDLIFLDLRMPSMDGFETCQRIKDDPDTEKIRVIGMSGQVTSEDEAKLLALGAEACLTKPLDENIVADYLARLLN